MIKSGVKNINHGMKPTNDLMNKSNINYYIAKGFSN